MPRINEANLEEHRRHTMNALLDSAEAIMHEQGGDALTPANVSKGAGIARNSIYRYVKDMKDLRRQLMARHMPKWLDALEEGLGDITDPAEIVVQWVKINLEQSVLQGHDWMTQIPLNDAESYRDDKGLWPNPEGKAGDDNEESDPEASQRKAKQGQDGVHDNRRQTSSNGNTSTSQRTASACPATHHHDIFCEHNSNSQNSNDQLLEPRQPSLHERVNAPIVAAWGTLCPENPQVGIALTEGLVSSGMRLLSSKEQTEETRTAAIGDIERACRAVVNELRSDGKTAQ